jgi:hypothetical protein
MEISNANIILQAAIDFDAGIGKIDDVISEMSNGDEREIWIFRLGNVMRVINEELILPIVKVYPELEFR